MFARSEGNPFFTEELLAVVRAGSRELPATLRDLLRGRVQVLPEPARQVLAVVAVAGRRMPHRLLAAVAGLDDRQLDGALREAVASQLLVTTPGEDGYDVRHALFREVIDADLLPGERTRLHTALARTLADLLRSGELDWSGSAAEVAVHWYRAGDLPEGAGVVGAGGSGGGRYLRLRRGFPPLRASAGAVGSGRRCRARAGMDRVEVLQRAAQAAKPAAISAARWPSSTRRWGGRPRGRPGSGWASARTPRRIPDGHPRT